MTFTYPSHTVVGDLRVLVYKLDRFSRDKYEMTIHKHTLKENGVKLVSAMEQNFRRRSCADFGKAI